MRKATLTIGKKNYDGWIQESRFSSDTRDALTDMGYKIASIRHADTDDVIPATLERDVYVNFFGHFVHTSLELATELDSIRFVEIEKIEYTYQSLTMFNIPV